MRAVRTRGSGDVDVVDVAAPEPHDGEVVVHVDAVGICSTDRKFVAREQANARILGHEIAGHLDAGTAVAVHPEITCERCDACAAGWHNRCPERVSLGLGRDGGLAERVVVPARQVLPVNGVDPLSGAMLEPLACVVHAVATSQIPDGSRAIVLGAGTMGLLTTWVLQSRGCSVVVVQRSEQRRHLARELGADGAIGPDDDPARLLGGPAEAIFVTAPGSDPLRWALENVRPGGTVNAFAGTPGGARVDANLVHYRHLRLLGSTGSRRSDHREARDLVADGTVDPRRLPLHVVTLDEAPRAVTEGPPPDAVKVLVAVGDGSYGTPDAEQGGTR